MGECSSNNDVPNASKKWPCAYCTYLNWEASLKCVICYQPRNRPMIIEELGAIEEFGSKLVLSDRFVKESAPRWSCPTCTYLNCQRTKRCAICGSTERPARFEEETSPTENHPNRKEKTVATVLSKDLLNKWSCSVCTFDNWPTVPKCTICGRLRSGGSANESEVRQIQQQKQQKAQQLNIGRTGRQRSFALSANGRKQQQHKDDADDEQHHHHKHSDQDDE
ncbi:hypothetical protein niasHT_020129 [Heterodera trifolii]|uniref:RanBP2-type domain-containing protein n=1 Tax=Heterodera trifolii TaxID=157864 RepID=A0ABD2LJR2_9BILA